MSEACAAKAYRPRDPRPTPLYRLVETFFEDVKSEWEERFEGRYGFWRGLVDEQVRRYLDCGLFENGFARIQCPGCHAEYLLAFSCKTRDLCPSCAAKRGAATAALLVDEVLGEVGHAQWVFVMPKMLRPYFLHHRELLGGLARAAWETALELMVTAAAEETLRPGMVAVVQTAEDLANWNPHVHALVSRGGWTQTGQWVPIPYIYEHAAELLFRHKVIRLLRAEGLLNDERTQLLLSWRHTGFSVHNRVRVDQGDMGALERLARYILRPPISLERMSWDNVGEVRYRRKPGHDQNPQLQRDPLKTFDAADFLARVIMHIPDPRRHLVRYCSWYSNVSRGKRRAALEEQSPDAQPACSTLPEDDQDRSPEALSLRRSWAQMIKRLYEVDPLLCPNCGSEMLIIAFIINHQVVDHILRHLKCKQPQTERGPPASPALEVVS